MRYKKLAILIFGVIFSYEIVQWWTVSRPLVEGQPQCNVYGRDYLIAITALGVDLNIKSNDTIQISKIKHDSKSRDLFHRILAVREINYLHLPPAITSRIEEANQLNCEKIKMLNGIISGNGFGIERKMALDSKREILCNFPNLLCGQ